MRYFKQLKEDYEESNIPGEGITWWYIRRVAPDWVRGVFVGIIFLFMIYTYTHPVFMVSLVEILAVVAVIALVVEPILYRKKRKEE